MQISKGHMGEPVLLLVRLLVPSVPDRDHLLLGDRRGDDLLSAVRRGLPLVVAVVRGVRWMRFLRFLLFSILLYHRGKYVYKFNFFLEISFNNLLP
jgi:hypothetical protein